MIKRLLFGTIKKFAPDVEETRTVQFVISTANKDRHKSVVNMNNWILEHFNANPVVGYQHNVYGDNLCTPPNPDDVLGPGRAWMEDTAEGRVLMGEVTFEKSDINPLAEKIFRKVLNGTLRATSVGFMEIGKSRVEEVKDGNGKVVDSTEYYEGQELLEFSIVNIPSNRQSLSRSINHHKDAALNFATRLLPELSINQIKLLRVHEVLDLVEKKLKNPDEDIVINQTDLFTDLDELDEDISKNKQQLCEQLKLRTKLNAQRLALSN